MLFSSLPNFLKIILSFYSQDQPAFQIINPKLLNRLFLESFTLKAGAKVVLFSELPNLFKKRFVFIFHHSLIVNSKWINSKLFSSFSLKAGAKVLALSIQTKLIQLFFLL